MFKTIRRMKSKVRRYFKEIIAAIIMSAIAGTGLANAEIMQVYSYGTSQYVIHGEQTLREFLGPAKRIHGESVTYGHGVEKDWLLNIEGIVIDGTYSYHRFFASEEGQNYNGLTDIMTVDEFLDNSFDVKAKSSNLIHTPIYWTYDGYRSMSIRDELYADKEAWGHLELLDDNVYYVTIAMTYYGGFAIRMYSGYDIETDSFTKYNMFVVDGMNYYAREYGVDPVVAVDLRSAIEKYDKIAEKVSESGPTRVRPNDIIHTHFSPRED